MKKNQGKQLSGQLICIPLLSLLLLNQAQADDSWKRPLAEKAQIIEAGIQKRHNILGLYPSMAEIWRVVSDKGFPALMQLGVRSELNHLVADVKESEKFYGAADRGVSVKGKTRWKKSEAGFNIPIVRSLFVSRYSDWVFAGTPGGLYISKDGGKTWQDGNLWLQFDKNTRRELGGASFIDAYWRARYYGFINSRTANMPFEN